MIGKGSLKRKVQYTIWSFFWKNFQLPEIVIRDVLPSYQDHEPFIFDDICLPPYHGDNHFIDYSILISFVKHIRPSKIIELGTAQGNTVANLCFESDALVYTINALPEQIEGDRITFKLSKDEIGRVYRNCGFDDRVSQIHENTQNLNIKNYLSLKTVDFAFIDACHDPEFVVNDFVKILPALSNKAIVLFHDTNPSVENQLLASYLGCMFLRKLGFNIKQIKGSTLGFWAAYDPVIKKSYLEQIVNYLHSSIGIIIYGNQVKFIQGLQWIGSRILKE